MTDHGIGPDSLNRIHELGKDIFDLPLDTKIKYNLLCGVARFLHAYWWRTVGKPQDWKESCKEVSQTYFREALEESQV